MKKLYEEGDTWMAETINGRIGKISLQEVYIINKKRYEVWRWSVIWNDGSGVRSDVCSSYRKCVEEIPMYNGEGAKPVRFKFIENKNGILIERDLA